MRSPHRENACCVSPEEIRSRAEFAGEMYFALLTLYWVPKVVPRYGSIPIGREEVPLIDGHLLKASSEKVCRTYGNAHLESLKRTDETIEKD